MKAILQVLKETWLVVQEMAPYLLFGFLAAGFLSVFVSAERIREKLGVGGWRGALRAALWGVPMPLCSCSVIPVALSLRRHGAGRSSTASFLLSAPQTGVDSILVTLAVLGPFFAVIRPVAAFLTGAIGGMIVGRLAERDPPLGDEAAACTEPCCQPASAARKVGRALRYGFVTLPQDIAVELLAGILVAGLITVLVPEDFFMGLFGKGLLSKLIMMAVGIPVYVCATASVPIAAALLLKGASAGAVLVFLMPGPATNAASLAAYRRMLGTRGLGIYLLVVAGSALAWGMLVDFVLTEARLKSFVGWSGGRLPQWLTLGCAVFLLVILVQAAYLRYHRHGHGGWGRGDHGCLR